MATLKTGKDWAKEIWRVEMDTPWVGGPDGTANVQASQLAARTEFLREGMDYCKDEIDAAKEGAKTLKDRIAAAGSAPRPLYERPFVDAVPAAASTENVDVEAGGLPTMDGVKLRAGDAVFLKDQTNPVENGFWIVQTGAWNRLPGYADGGTDCFTDKFIDAPAGNENGGLIFAIDADAYTIGKSSLIFRETIFSSTKKPHKAVIRNRDGEVDDLADIGSLTNRVRTLEGWLPPDPRTLPERFVVRGGRRQLIVRAGTRVALPGGDVFYAPADEAVDAQAALDGGGELEAGRDYYLFLRPAGDGGLLAVSSEKAADGLLIGGFHTLCADAGEELTYVWGGETLEHPLSGLVAGDILPESVWCLNHRPYSEPEGMVYVPTLDFWCDIYLQSGIGADTRSARGGALTRNRQYVDVVEDFLCVRKELLDDGEFAAATAGGNERTSVAGASEAGATTGGAGGRMDTKGRRMLSIFGVEEGCGSLWQWLRSASAGGSSGWSTQSGGKGDMYGFAGVLLAGGDWSNAAYCGSRGRDAANSRPYASASVGGRGRSRAMR